MLWGAFNNASSAMMAMSWDMGSISQNVANVNTVGYKRKETLFQTVMSESKATGNGLGGGRLNIFGVQTADRNHIEAQGVITPSAVWSDLAINGEGFFMLATPGDDGPRTTFSTDNPEQVLYTRAGAFSRTTGPDSDDQYIRNYFTVGGNYLLGYMADDTGAYTSTTLEPVYTRGPRPIANNGTTAVDASGTTAPVTTMPGRATTNASVRANLPAGTAATAQAHQSTVTVTDPNGNPQTMTLSWARSAGAPQSWTVTATLPGGVGTVTAPIAVTMDAYGNITSPTPTTQSLTINWDDGTYGALTPDSTTTVNVASSKPTTQLHKINVPVYDDAFGEHTMTLAFERIGTNRWAVWPDAGQNATTGSTPTPTVLDFSDTGQLTTATTTLPVTLSWTSGTPATTTTATLDVDLSQLTQYEDTQLYLGGIDQDGYTNGTLTKTWFTEMGELRGYFSNGRERSLFKVPVAQFTAQNSLEAVSGTMFKRTAAAGDLVVATVDQAIGEPRLATSSLENSTVDIEDEFTKMIVTQKAYSTNATVFKTADEMTMTVRDLMA